MDYASYEYYLSAALLVCAMFGMGTTLTARDFLAVVRAPQGIALILLMQVLVTPLLSLLIARVFFLPQEISLGLLVYGALPGGLFSNVFTYLGRGNVALSVSATSACSVGCLITTTFVLKTFGTTQLPADFAMPVDHILTEITTCLLLPLAAGMVFRRLAPDWHATVAKVCVWASVIMLGLVILGATTSGRIDITDYGLRAPVAMIVVQILLVWICFGLGRALRLSYGDRFTVIIEVLMRNSHLGVLLTAALFPPPAGGGSSPGGGVLYVVLLAGMISIVLGVIEIFAKRRYWGFYAPLRAEEHST